MRKKLALVLAATLALSVFAVGCGSNSTNEDPTTKKQEQSSDKEDDKPAFEPYTFGLEDKSQTWWTEFSEYYKETGDFKKVITIDVDGGTANWNSFVVALTTGERDAEGYSEYAVVRPDNWGWGGGDNFSKGGNAIEYTKSDELLFDASKTPSFAETANQSVITLTVERVAGVVTLTFDIAGDNGENIQTTAKVTDNFGDDLTFFMVADGSYCKVTEVK